MGSSRSSARIIRFAVFALLLIGCGFILSGGSTYSGLSNDVSTHDPAATEKKTEQKVIEHSKEPEHKAGGALEKEGSTNAKGDAKSDTKGEVKSGDKVKATFVSLARNADLHSLLQSVRQVEDRFNSKFHYDWVFLNDEEFSDEFKRVTSRAVSGKTKYGVIPKEQWSYPEWIDKEKAALAREELVRKKVIYGGSESYRHMCRYESGFFWRHELMMDYDYYWRVEPDVKIYCDVDYDIFKWMQENNKDYGFTISLPEYKETIPTLWEETKKYISENPSSVAENNLMDWISDDKGETYNGCHFWSNFEIASLKLWRSDAYTKYFDHLDKAGGFFYERWGDAPVHSIAASLFLPRDKIHFFQDVGYYHVPFNNCPVDEETRLSKNCVCNPNDDFTWRGWSCTTKYFTVKDLKRPKGWENFTQ